MPGKKRVIKNASVYAFVDGNNLYLGAKSQHIKLHYGDLRLYLKNKLGVEKTFLFIGYDPNKKALYKTLESYGYSLVFKPTIVYTENGKRTMKGNVDAELVLHSAAIEYKNYKKAIIITSDGDFACLVKYLDDKNKLGKIITPTRFYSSLFKPYASYVLPLNKIKENISRDYF